MAGSVLAANSEMRVLFRKIKARLRSGANSEVIEARHPAVLPSDGERISVELALNSRCTSDNDGDPETFHWGMFDPSARLSPEQVNRIVRLAENCRIADGRSKVEAHNASLTFSLDAAGTRHEREIAMIESGMQQQAVCLTCAALGIGMVFESQGPDGTQASTEKFITTKMRLGAMKPSYNGAFWNASTPEKERPWVMGNLPDPTRNGRTPLLTALGNLRVANRNGAVTSTSNLSQLLWAARGRTPHLYKSSPWGLTIPTWQGLQNISSVYVAADSGLYRYVNWKNGHPTHRLEAEKNPPRFDRLRDLLPSSNCFVILATNEPQARALWEVGYQVLNIVLQASALGIKYRTLVLSEQDQVAFSGVPVGTPTAMIGLQISGEQFLKKI